MLVAQKTFLDRLQACTKMKVEKPHFYIMFLINHHYYQIMFSAIRQLISIGNNAQI